VPPKSTTGKALKYFHNERVYLESYSNYGEVFIDNNFIENKIRPFAVGRNRCLFSDTVDGARASATQAERKLSLDSAF
jgi:transposase